MPALICCSYGVAVAKNASFGLVFEVAADVELAGAHAPPLGNTWPAESVELQLVLTNITPKLLVPIGTRPS